MTLFPYDSVRDGQSLFLKKAAEALKEKRSLIVHAPTGIGKTVSALSPALDYALANNMKVIFLTSRHSQHKIVIDTLRTIEKKHNVKLKVSDLIGKKWLCNQETVDTISGGDFSEYCSSLVKNRACSHYNNTYEGKTSSFSAKAEKVTGVLQGLILHAEEAKERCVDVCPYEVIMRTTKDASVIIADYFHVFHPVLSQSFFAKTNTNPKNTILVVDEAHNLPARCREMVSDSLTQHQLQRAIKEAEDVKERELVSILHEIRRDLDALFIPKLDEKQEYFLTKENLTDVIEKYMDLDAFVAKLEFLAEKVRQKKHLSFLGGISSFLEGWQEETEGYARLLRKVVGRLGKSQWQVSRNCLDPSLLTGDVFRSMHSTILMSGTLLPLHMYRHILGLGNADELQLDSPFPNENRLSLLGDEVTSKYSERNEEQLYKIAKYVIKACNNTPGNSAVFFPSYSMQRDVLQLIGGTINRKMLVERQGMAKKEKAEMLKEFIFLADEGAVLFAVVGANFSEGVDLPGKLLNTVVLVGLPLEKPDLLTEALIKYYDLKFGQGWNYGYTYPAMNRAVQTAGRCIRSERDRGVILFLDSRYGQEQYRKLIPSEYRLKRVADVSEEISSFFVSKSKLSAFSK